MSCCYICLNDEGLLIDQPCECKIKVHKSCFDAYRQANGGLSRCTICTTSFEPIQDLLVLVLKLLILIPTALYFQYRSKPTCPYPLVGIGDGCYIPFGYEYTNLSYIISQKMESPPIIIYRCNLCEWNGFRDGVGTCDKCSVVLCNECLSEKVDTATRHCHLCDPKRLQKQQFLGWMLHQIGCMTEDEAHQKACHDFIHKRGYFSTEVVGGEKRKKLE